VRELDDAFVARRGAACTAGAAAERASSAAHTALHSRIRRGLTNLMDIMDIRDIRDLTSGKGSPDRRGKLQR